MQIDSQKYLFISILLAGFLSACSVYKNIDASIGTDVSRVIVGITRVEAEEILGPPILEGTTTQGVNYSIYTYDLGASKTKAYSLASLNLLMDFCTVGLWESVLLTDPSAPGGSEMFFLDTKYEDLVIFYNDEDVTTKIIYEFINLDKDISEVTPTP